MILCILEVRNQTLLAFHHPETHGWGTRFPSRGAASDCARLLVPRPIGHLLRIPDSISSIERNQPGPENRR